MIRYKHYQDNRSNSNNRGKWYARAVTDETYDIEALAKHMAKHGSPFSAGTIKGVLEDMVDCVQELCADGKNVKIDDLAIFSIRLKVKPSDTLEDFRADENITGVRMLARATGAMRQSVMTRVGGLKFLEVGSFDTPEQAANT